MQENAFAMLSHARWGFLTEAQLRFELCINYKSWLEHSGLCHFTRFQRYNNNNNIIVVLIYDLMLLQAVHYYPDLNLFQSRTLLNYTGSIQPISHMSISSCQVLNYGSVNQSSKTILQWWDSQLHYYIPLHHHNNYSKHKIDVT
jgi:hypothetical protein